MFKKVKKKPLRERRVSSDSDEAPAAEEEEELTLAYVAVCDEILLAVKVGGSGSFALSIYRGRYRISLRGGRPMINWCLNATY